MVVDPLFLDLRQGTGGLDDSHEDQSDDTTGEADQESIGDESPARRDGRTVLTAADAERKGDRMDEHPAPASKRGHATLLVAGAGILLTRTIVLLRGGARAVLQPWVVALTYLEMLLDAATAAGAMRWWWTRSPSDARLPLRTGAAATLLHAGRVLVYLLGRTGPWVNFDVRPDRRADHDDRWSWSQVVIASVLSILGVIGTGVVWRWRARHAVAIGRSASTPIEKWL